MSLLLNMPSRLVITFLPRSKCLLISWLQSPSVILEPQKMKSATVSTVSPSICHEVMGPDASSHTDKWIHGGNNDTWDQMQWIYICMHVCMLSSFSRVWIFATLWTVTCQAPLPMGFSRQEYWSGLPCLPPGDLLNPGTEPISYVSCLGRQVLYH